MWEFNKTVTVGNLLTAVSLVALIIVFELRIEGRLSVEEALQSEDHAIILKQEDIIAQLQITVSKLSAIEDVQVLQMTNIQQRVPAEEKR